MIDKYALFQASEQLFKEGGSPRLILISERAFWGLKYSMGHARYSPRIKGFRRPCRMKFKASDVG